MEEYDYFINQYFPLSHIIDNAKNIYCLVCENNLISKIMLKYINLNVAYTNMVKLVFYRRFRDGINKILLYLPINEEIGIYACMRYSIEQFLKFIYAIYFDESIERIARVSYRHIKEDIKENVEIAGEIKKELQKVYTYYAKYSNDIHAKEFEEDEELISLGKIIKSKNEYANDIETDLRNILNSSYRTMQAIFSVKYEMLEASERINIENFPSSKGKKRIYEILDYK